MKVFRFLSVLGLPTVEVGGLEGRGRGDGPDGPDRHLATQLGIAGSAELTWPPIGPKGANHGCIMQTFASRVGGQHHCKRNPQMLRSLEHVEPMPLAPA